MLQDAYVRQHFDVIIIISRWSDLTMGAFLDKPKTDKHNEHGIGNGLQYGLSSMQGWRIEMEDAHAAVANLPGILKVTFIPRV